MEDDAPNESLDFRRFRGPSGFPRVVRRVRIRNVYKTIPFLRRNQNAPFESRGRYEGTDRGTFAIAISGSEYNNIANVADNRRRDTFRKVRVRVYR